MILTFYDEKPHGLNDKKNILLDLRRLLWETQSG